MKMQQTKSYWRFVALAGVVTAFVASACVVTTSTDDDTAGAAGTSTAGASSAGAAGAGAGAGAGGAATAGAGGAAAGAGGMAPTPYQCDPADGVFVGTPNTCAPAPGFEMDVCALCTQQKCCTEYSNCFATSPGNQCGWGGPNDQSEAICVQNCIQTEYPKTGVYDDSLVETCAANCATTKAGGSAHDCGSIIGQQTNDLIACLGMNCQSECYTGEPK